MPATFYYGPNATPFFIDGRGIAIDRLGRAPFHGILSLGLLEYARGSGSAAASWAELGHRLDESSNADIPALRQWREAARVCGVLRFSQSAACAHAYVRQLLADPERAMELFPGGVPAEAPHVSLWNVKEGHISSVWCVRISCGGGLVEFALNIARDRPAGEELRRISERMQRAAEAWPEARLARVQEIAEVQLPTLSLAIVVSRNDWIAHALEIHCLPAPEGKEEILVAVERFLTDENAPSQIVRIKGHRLTTEETAQVRQELAEFLYHTAALAVQIEINHGDLVWDGEHAVVVALR